MAQRSGRATGRATCGAAGAGHGGAATSEHPKITPFWACVGLDGGAGAPETAGQARVGRAKPACGVDMAGQFSWRTCSERLSATHALVALALILVACRQPTDEAGDRDVITAADTETADAAADVETDATIGDVSGATDAALDGATPTDSTPMDVPHGYVLEVSPVDSAAAADVPLDAAGVQPNPACANGTLWSVDLAPDATFVQLSAVATATDGYVAAAWLQLANGSKVLRVVRMTATGEPMWSAQQAQSWAPGAQLGIAFRFDTGVNVLADGQLLRFDMDGQLLPSLGLTSVRLLWRGGMASRVLNPPGLLIQNDNGVTQSAVALPPGWSGEQAVVRSDDGAIWVAASGGATESATWYGGLVRVEQGTATKVVSTGYEHTAVDALPQGQVVLCTPYAVDASCAVYGPDGKVLHELAANVGGRLAQNPDGTWWNRGNTQIDPLIGAIGWRECLPVRPPGAGILELPDGHWLLSGQSTTTPGHWTLVFAEPQKLGAHTPATPASCPVECVAPTCVPSDAAQTLHELKGLGSPRAATLTPAGELVLSLAKTSGPSWSAVTQRSLVVVALDGTVKHKTQQPFPTVGSAGYDFTALHADANGIWAGDAQWDTPDGNVKLTAFYPYGADVPAWTLPIHTRAFAQGPTDMWLASDSTAKLAGNLTAVTPTGQILWQKQLDPLGNLKIGQLFRLPDGGALAAVTTATLNFYGGGGETWAMRLDATGNVVWQTPLGAGRPLTGDQEPNGMWLGIGQDWLPAWSPLLPSAPSRAAHVGLDGQILQQLDQPGLTNLRAVADGSVWLLSGTQLLQHVDPSGATDWAREVGNTEVAVPVALLQNGAGLMVASRVSSVNAGVFDAYAHWAELAMPQTLTCADPLSVWPCQTALAPLSLPIVGAQPSLTLAYPDGRALVISQERKPNDAAGLQLNWWTATGEPLAVTHWPGVAIELPIAATLLGDEVDVAVHTASDTAAPDQILRFATPGSQPTTVALPAGATLVSAIAASPDGGLYIAAGGWRGKRVGGQISELPSNQSWPDLPAVWTTGGHLAYANGPVQPWTRDLTGIGLSSPDNCAPFCIAFPEDKPTWIAATTLAPGGTVAAVTSTMSALQIWLLSATGQTLWLRTAPAPMFGPLNLVGLSDGGLAVAYVNEAGVRVMRYSAGGDVLWQRTLTTCPGPWLAGLVALPGDTLQLAVRAACSDDGAVQGWLYRLDTSGRAPCPVVP